MTRGWTVRYRVPCGPVVALDVLADCASDAAAAVRALVPDARIVETAGRHLLDMAGDAPADCGDCGHSATDHVSDPFTGDTCDRAGYGHGDGSAPVSLHLCSCSGYSISNN